jgi:uncharacterized repeat protein (TIGR01451 family)
MSARQRFVALALGVWLGCLAVALSSRLWADQKVAPAKTAQLPQQPMSPEPPLAPPPGQPGVRDIPTPQGPPAVRVTPGPAVPIPIPAGAAGTNCPVDPPAPVVSIKVRVPACAAPSEVLEYRIHVENHAKSAAHHVIVRNPLPLNAVFVHANPPPTVSDPVLEWRLGTLEGCACRDIVLALKPTGTGDVKNCARVQFEHGECVCTKIGGPPSAPPPMPVGQPRLTLRKIGPERAILHNPLDYQLIVTNAGSAEARGVMLTDTMPEGMQHGASGKSQITWDVGTLAPGQSRTYDYQVITTKTGKLCNRAEVSAGTLRETAESCVTVGEAKLTVTKSGPDVQFFKRPATYQITVINEGSMPLTNVVISDALPEKTSLTKRSEGGQRRDNQVEWLIGTLQPGGRKSVQITLQATEPAKVVNKATARADGVAPLSTEFTTNFESAPGLTMYIEPPENPTTVGAATLYTITVVNTGSVAANEIDVVASLPEQMEIKAIRPKDARQDRQQVTFPRVLMLEGGRQLVFEIDVVPKRAAADAAMKATMTTKELPTGVTKEVRTNIAPNGSPPETRQ